MLKHMPPSSNAGPTVNTHTRPPRSLNRATQPLNISTISTPGNNHSFGIPNGKVMNGNGLPPPRMPMFATPLPSLSSHSNFLYNKERAGAREALTSLGLLCLVSLLLALLSLIFLLKISPGGRDLPPPPIPAAPEDYAIVYDVTLALCALSLSLNLCCLLVCAIQFLFAVKLVRTPPIITGRGNKYLQKSSVSRVCAVGGFFISIPIFLTGIILYTFTQFHSTPAIVTSILIGIGILFCGGAMVHNVFVWQKEKTISVRQIPMSLNISAITPPAPFMNHSTATNHVSFNPQHNQSHSTTLNTLNHTPMTHIPGLNRTTPVTQLTPVTQMSANHSHLSFNHSYLPYTIRTATATPPTPKVGPSLNLNLNGRDASGSVSPPVLGPPPTLDLNVTATNSPHHELSTLV